MALASAIGWVFAPWAVRGGDTTSGDVELSAELATVIDDLRGFQSVHVSVITSQDVRHAAIGSAAPAAGAPLTEFSPIELGSVTKTFDGLLLADAIERAEVATDDQLERWLPELTGTAIGGVLLEELASHRAGLPPMTRGGIADQVIGAITNTDRLRSHTREGILAEVGRMPLMGQRGTIQYSNLGATLLGWALAEAAEAADWPAYVTERLLSPLGMHSTVFATTPAKVPPDAVRGRLSGGRRAVQGIDPAYLPAGSSTWTTAHDLAAYAQAILTGDAPGMAALPPRWSEPRAPQPPGAGIGFAWFTSTLNGHTVHWHNGATTGFRTIVAVDMTAQKAVIVVGNSARPVDSIAWRMLTGRSDGPGSTAAPLPIAGIVLASVVLIAVGSLVAVGS